MFWKNRLMFTNKKHPKNAMLSSVLGMISVVSIVLTMVFTFQNNGVALPRYGLTVLLAGLFGVVGFFAGITSRMEPDRYYLFSYIGIILNLLSIISVLFILYVGVYGL